VVSATHFRPCEHAEHDEAKARDGCITAPGKLAHPAAPTRSVFYSSRPPVHLQATLPLLRALFEIFQVRGRLVLPRWHQMAVPAQEIILPGDFDVSITKEITCRAKHDDNTKLLMTMPGVGSFTALLIKAPASPRRSPSPPSHDSSHRRVPLAANSNTAISPSRDPSTCGGAWCKQPHG
jgi:hypothetical protein